LGNINGETGHGGWCGEGDETSTFFPPNYENGQTPVDDLPLDSLERSFAAYWLIFTIQDAQYYAQHRHIAKEPKRQAQYEESVEIHAEWITSERFFSICELLNLSPYRWSSLIMDVLKGKRELDHRILVPTVPPVSSEVASRRGFGSIDKDLLVILSGKASAKARQKGWARDKSGRFQTATG
jgi:hypothetical protein